LDRLRHFVWLREEMRDLSSRVYYLIRRAVLRVAAVRGWGDDVFFMTWQEILEGNRDGVEAARQTYEGYRHFAAPNEIGRGGGVEAVGGAEDGVLRGLAASGGVASAPAFVARSIEEASAMPPGCILICPFTDPGWTTMLHRAAGVVTETGGLLSHAAVICREYGIPEVLAVEGATRRIRRGQAVTVLGSEGRVALEDGSTTLGSRLGAEHDVTTEQSI
jgi:pyruvate,water dikinase